MKNLSRYIHSLNFEYAISYSGLRGELFAKLEVKNKEKVKIIENEMKSARFMKRPSLNKNIKNLQQEINIYNSRIINIRKEVHQSTIRIHKFNKEDLEIQEIFHILDSKFEEHYHWMCPPIFRDAIVFYSKEDEIKGIIQICFSCGDMKDENEQSFEVDYKIFPKLMDKLIQLGHEITNKN